MAGLPRSDLQPRWLLALFSGAEPSGPSFCYLSAVSCTHLVTQAQCRAIRNQFCRRWHFSPKPGTYAIRQDHQIRSCPRTACRNGARRRLRLHEKGGKEHEMPVRRIKALQVSRRRVAPVLQPAHFPRKMPAHLRDVLIRKLARLIPQLTS